MPIKHYKNNKWKEYDKFKKEELLSFIFTAKEILNKLPSAYKKNRYGKDTFKIRHITLILILRQLLQKDYRGIIGFLNDHKELQEAIGLTKLPHYTLLQKKSKLISEEFLQEFFKEFAKHNKNPDLAVDATGFSSSYASKYYTQKVNKQVQITDYLKLHALEDINTQLILSAIISEGRMHESPFFMKLLDKLPQCLSIGFVAADKGYDAKKHHWYVQTVLKTESVIKIRSEEYITFRSDRYRKNSLKRFKDGLYTEKYGKRSLIESMFSVIKRVLGESLSSRTFITQRIELLFRLMAYNIRVQLKYFGYFS